MTQFEVQRKDVEHVSVLNISGYLDAHTAPKFEAALEKLQAEGRYNIVVALKNLQYISSAGLGVFMAFIENLRDHKGDIKISQASPRVFKVFDLLGFPSLYEFYENVTDAIEKYSDLKKEES